MTFGALAAFLFRGAQDRRAPHYIKKKERIEMLAYMIASGLAVSDRKQMRAATETPCELNLRL
jgi:hypothetical protein